MPETPSRPFLDPVTAGDLDAIRAVAASGVDIDGAMNIGRPRHDYSPLTLAIELRNVDSVRTLLEVGADPNATDPLGRTPLQAALGSVTLDTAPTVEAICGVLIDGGATVTEDVRDDALDSFTGMGEPMYSEAFLARLSELSTASTTASEDTE